MCSTMALSLLSLLGHSSNYGGCSQGKQGRVFRQLQEVTCCADCSKHEPYASLSRLLIIIIIIIIVVSYKAPPPPYRGSAASLFVNFDQSIHRSNQIKSNQSRSFQTEANDHEKKSPKIISVTISPTRKEEGMEYTSHSYQKQSLYTTVLSVL